VHTHTVAAVAVGHIAVVEAGRTTSIVVVVEVEVEVAERIEAVVEVDCTQNTVVGFDSIVAVVEVEVEPEMKDGVEVETLGRPLRTAMRDRVY